MVHLQVCVHAEETERYIYTHTQVLQIIVIKSLDINYTNVDTSGSGVELAVKSMWILSVSVTSCSAF